MLVAVNSRAGAGRDSLEFVRPFSPSLFGVQLSTDGGLTWTRTLGGEATALEVDSTNFNRQYTAISLPAGYGAYGGAYSPVPTGVYRSPDGGRNWAVVAGPWSGQTFGRIALAMAPSNPNTLYASVQGSDRRLLGLFRTDNAWATSPTWMQIPTGGSWSTLGLNYADYCGTDCTATNMIAVDPSNEETLYAGGSSLWRCNSCGAAPTWTDIGFGAQWSIPSGKRCVAWSGSVLIACTDGGVFSTATGTGPWQDNNAGLSVVRFISGDLHPSDPNVALGGTWDNGAALWAGGSWQSLRQGSGEVAISAGLPSDMMTAAGTIMFRTTNSGRTFAQANGGFTADGWNGAILPVRKCPAIDDMLLAGSNLIQRSNDFFSGSAHWVANGTPGDSITAIGFAASDTQCNTYAFGTSIGKIRITVDGGSTWSNADPKGSIPGRAVASLAFDRTNGNTLYAAFAGYNGASTIPGHLFRTTNALSSAPEWSDVSPVADLPINVVAVDPSNPGNIYVGTDAAVWYSSNGGSGWQFLGPSTGMPNVPVYDLKINPATNRIVAFTFGRGAWVLDLLATPPSGTLPTLPTSATLQAMLGAQFSLSLSTGGNSTYTYSVVGALPLGLVLSAGGEIVGTPLSAGLSTFTILVTDGFGNTASQSYTLLVVTNGAAPVWTNIGPSPLYANWPHPSPGLTSGRVASIAVDPSDVTHWLVGFGNGGIWETRTSGSFWRPIANSAPTLATGAIAFAPGNPSVIYAGTGEPGGGIQKAGLGMLKSTDGGATWSTISTSSFAQASVKRIRVNPSNPNNVLAVTTQGGIGRNGMTNAPSPPPMGIVRSTDGGVTWTRTLAGQTTALEIHATNFSNQYAAIGADLPNQNNDPGKVANGLYRSSDGGQTWSLVPGPWGSATPSAAPFGWIELAISPSSPNTLYASIAMPGDSTGLLGLYRTDNAWDPNPNWIQIPTGAPAYCGPSKCDYANVISVHPSDPSTLYAFGGDTVADGSPSGTGAFRCSNCGTTPAWTYVGSGVHNDHHAIAWAGTLLINGNDGGLWSTADSGNTWNDLNATISTNMFYSGDLHASAPDFMVGGLRDFGPSVRYGSNIWSELPTGLPFGEAEVAISSSHPDTDWMLAGNWGLIGRTRDGGNTGLEVDAGIDNTAVAFVAPVRKCPNNDDIFLTGTNRIWRTNNFFNSSMPTWAANSPFGSPNARLSPVTILSIAFAPSDATCNTYAYGTLGGQVQLTHDGGNTWTNLDSKRALPSRAIEGLAFDPSDSNTLYLALSSFNDATPKTPGHVYKTINALSTSPSFADVSPPQDQPFNVIAIDPMNPKVVYAGSDVGLWRSNDGARTWQRQGTDVGMPSAPVYDIKINPATGRTVVFTYGRGAFILGPELFSVMPSADGGATYAPGQLVPGAWAQVRGAQLAGVTAGSDPNSAPPILNGVQVTVNGVAASIYSITPAAIAFQVPLGATGNASVQVLRDGVPSNAITAVTAPGMLPPAAIRDAKPGGLRHLFRQWFHRF